MSIYLKGYLIAALSDHSPDGYYRQVDVYETEKDSNVESYFSPEFVAKAQEDCEAFENLAESFLEEAGEYQDSDSIGMDFWLTRNGAGSGFWDGSYSEDHSSGPIGLALTEISKSFGEVCCLLGSDLLGPDGNWEEENGDSEESND